MKTYISTKMLEIWLSIRNGFLSGQNSHKTTYPPRFEYDAFTPLVAH